MKTMMFMKSERYLIKKFIEKITLSCVSTIVLMVSLTFMMGFYYEPNIYIKLDDFTVELGEKLPDEINNYMNLITDKSNLSIESNVPLDEEGNTKEIGVYSYYFTYNDDNFRYSKLTNTKSKITVIDTIKPTITIKEGVEVEYDGEISATDVAECFDLSGCELSFEEEIDTTVSGEHEVSIIATDGGDNKSSAKVKVTVKEKPAPPQPVYSYYPYAGIGYSAMDMQNNANNALLSEEEKSSLRQQIANFALQFVGNPYVYGGTSLTNGTDCSGFTMTIYATFGYALPRSAFEQAYVGTPVSEAELLPGDLVVYYGHVGLYVGGGMMVHAATPADGIKYAPMYNDYRTYRRIIV